MMNQVHRLVQHWVNKVLTSWNSVKRSTKNRQPGKGLPIPVITVYRPFFHFRYQNSTCSSSAEKAAGVKSGSGKPNKDKVGKVTSAQIREIAETKAADMTGADVDAMMRSIEGTARSMGLVVED